MVGAYLVTPGSMNFMLCMATPDGIIAPKGTILQVLKLSNKVDTQRCILLDNFLEEVSIIVKRRLTDSVISSSRNAAVHIYFNLESLVSS